MTVTVKMSCHFLSFKYKLLGRQLKCKTYASSIGHCLLSNIAHLLKEYCVVS